MSRIAADPQSLKALVIDGNPTSRSILASMLRDLGIGSVVQTSKVVDARRHLEHRVFDVVLCDYHFDGASYTGQELLDDLRRAQLLPFSTVFIMVTGEASYARVAEAAESALDGYLLKPHNATTLAARVQQARHRKTVLREIFEAIEAEAFEHAARLCLQRFAARSQYWLYAARIGAELLLRLGQHDAARQLFEAVTATSALPWARLGISRAQADAGQLGSARRTLESLIVDEPSFTDAYDVMGRVQMEQGDMGEALATYRRAVELTPSAISRLQKQGMLAFYMGETDEAMRTLERAVAVGITSKMFDYQSLVLLALAAFDKRESKALNRCYDNIAHMQAKVPNSQRLRRFTQIVGVFKLLMARQLARVVEEVKDIAGEIRQESLDFEAACNVAAMLARVRTNEVQLADDEVWISALAQRFCVSKATSELLAQAASAWPPYSERIRNEHLAVSAQAEAAMAHSVKGRPRASVSDLLEHGSNTLNAKLIDMARLVLQRHRVKIDDADDLEQRIEDLRRRFCTGSSLAQLGNTTGRQAGGLSLRAKPAEPQAGANPAPPTSELAAARGSDTPQIQNNSA